MPYCYDHLSVEIKNKSKYFNDALIFIGSRVSSGYRSSHERSIETSVRLLDARTHADRGFSSERQNECLALECNQRTKCATRSIANFYEETDNYCTRTVLKEISSRFSSVYIFVRYLLRVTSRATAIFRRLRPKQIARCTRSRSCSSHIFAKDPGTLKPSQSICCNYTTVVHTRSHTYTHTHTHTYIYIYCKYFYA